MCSANGGTSLGRATDQRIVHAFVQATNSLTIVALFVNLEMRSEKKFRWKLLDREADGVSSAGKTLVANWLSP